MKQKLSITLDEDTLRQITEQLNSGKFRNKSHLIEYALIKFLEDHSSKTSDIIPPTSPQTHHEEQNGRDDWRYCKDCS